MGQLCSRASLDEDIVPAFPLHGSPGNHTLIQTLCWPREESLSRCEEAQGSGGYETFALVLNAASSVAIGAAGLVSLLASDFSDEVGDLASAMTAVNGVGGLLALLTRLRVVEEVELQSMLIAALLFFKGMIRVLFPVINRSQYLRTVINLALVITMFTAACWTSFNLPPELYNRSHLSRRWATDLVVPLLWLAIATMSLLVYLTDHEFLDQVPHEEAPAAAPITDGSTSGEVDVETSEVVAKPESRRPPSARISMTSLAARSHPDHVSNARPLRHVIATGIIVALCANGCFFIDR